MWLETATWNIFLKILKIVNRTLWFPHLASPPEDATKIVKIWGADPVLYSLGFAARKLWWLDFKNKFNVFNNHWVTKDSSLNQLKLFEFVWTLMGPTQMDLTRHITTNPVILVKLVGRMWRRKSGNRIHNTGVFVTFGENCVKVFWLSTGALSLF